MKILLFVLLIFQLLVSGTKTLAQGQPTDFSLSIGFNNGDYSICMGNPRFVFGYSYTSSSKSQIFEWYLNDVRVDSFTKSFNDPWNAPAKNLILDSLKAGDSIYCIMTSGYGYTGYKIKSNTIVMHDGSLPPPEVHIDVPSTTVCNGNEVTFSPITGGYGRIINYIWTVNGDVVQQGRLPQLVTSTLKDGSVIGLRWIVSACGGGTAYDDAEPVTIRVKPQINPTLKVTAPFSTVCQNSITTFTAKAEDGGQNPDYLWKLNGNPVGTNSTVFSTNLLRQGDEVSCQLLTDTATYCSIQPADTIKIQVVKSEPATVTIIASGTTICEGLPVEFTALTTNEGLEASYQWLVNGVQTADTTKTFTSKLLKDRDAVTCVLKTKNACSASPEIKSNTISLHVNPLPQITILTKDTTIRVGSVLQLEARVLANAHSYNWLPAAYLLSPLSLTTYTRPLITGTISFVFEAISEAGCTSEGRVNVVVKQPLYMPNAFTPNGDGTNDVFKIPQGSDIDLQEFAVFDKWGNKVFQTQNPAKGWDGNYKNAILPGTYVYMITGKINSGEKVTIKGTVILIL